MAFYQWTKVALIIIVLLIDVTYQEIHRAKSNAQKSVVKQPNFGYVNDSQNVMEINLEVWAYSVTAAILVGLSGIFPLLVIPMESGPALKHGGNTIIETIFRSRAPPHPLLFNTVFFLCFRGMVEGPFKRGKLVRIGAKRGKLLTKHNSIFY